MEPFDVFAHHTAFRNAGTDYRTGCHKRDVVIAMQFFEQPPHSRAFNIKTTNGLTLFKLFLHAGIILEFFHVVYVNGKSPIFLHNICALLYMPNTTLA